MPFARPLLHGRWPFRALAATFALAACGLAVQAQSDLQTLVSTGQYMTALDKLDAESAQSPRDARLIAQRAMLLSLQKRDSQALRLLEGLTARQPELAQPQHLMALILTGNGDYEAARAAAARAVRADRGYLPALKTLGDVQARQARQAFEQALRLDSGNAGLRQRIDALTAIIGLDVVGPGASPFAQRGAIAALAPPSAPAWQASLPLPAANGNGNGRAVVDAPAPPSPRRLVALPDGVASAELAAATRHGETSKAATFNGLSGAMPPASSFFGKPTIGGSVGAEPVAVAPRATAPAVTAVTAARLQSAAQADVDAALRAWAAAWSRRDVAGYLAAYAPEFTGEAGSREAWERERRERIGARATISVELSEVLITVDGDRAEVRFRQHYASDKVNAVNRKLLQWQRAPGGAWRISRETVDG